MTLPSLSARPEPPQLPPTTSPWRPGQPTYLAVRGADWQPDVGGDDYGEGRGQLDGEAAVGGRREAVRAPPGAPQELPVDWAARHQNPDIAAASQGTRCEAALSPRARPVSLRVFRNLT